MKNTTYIIAFLIIAVVVIFFLNKKGLLPDNPLQISELPTKRPSDMIIEVSKGGGMLPISKSLYISKDSCYQRHWAYRVENKTYFTLSDAELDELYKAFVDNKFDLLKTYHSQTYDRGGTSVYLRINRKTYKINDSGGTYLRKYSLDNFKNILNKVYNLVATKTTALKQDFDIHLEQSIIDLSISGHISSSTADYSKGFKKGETFVNKVSLKLVPGKHHFRISFTTKDTLPNGKTYLGEAFKLDIDKTTKGINISQDSSNTLKFEYIR